MRQALVGMDKGKEEERRGNEAESRRWSTAAVLLRGARVKTGQPAA